MTPALVQYRPVTLQDIDGIVQLCREQGWPSYIADRDKTWRALTAPGVCTIVAVEAGNVVGCAQMQSDGIIQAHLSVIAVASDHRRKGIGKRLVEEACARSGAQRVDLLSDSAEEFYRSFRFREIPGFRIYP